MIDSKLAVAIGDLEIAAPRVVVGRDVGHREGLHIAADGGQRRHQLVRDIGEELPPGSVRGRERAGARLQIVGHPVEGAREIGDLVAAAFVRAHVGPPFAERS